MFVDKIRFILLGVMLWLVYSVAPASVSLHIGYCDGELSETGISKVGKAEVSAAIVLSQEELLPYLDAEIVAVRIGLISPEGQITNLQGWVRESLEGDNLDSGSIDNPVDGWNETPLSLGLKITAGKELVVGYSFNQDKSARCISVAGRNEPGGCWIAKNGEWEDQRRTAKASVSVELVVQRADFPEKDLAIIRVDSEPVVAYSDKLTVSYTVRNASLQPIEGFDCQYTIAGSTPVVLYVDERIEYKKRWTGSFEIDSSVVPMGLGIPVEISVIAEGDGNPDNDNVEILYSSYDDFYPRRVLIEEFTSEECVNCPRAIETLKECMAAGYDEKCVIIAHHVGYYDDWLTVEEDKAYTWLYGEDGTYAPAVTLDRTTEAGNQWPVSSIAYASTFMPRIDNALSVPSFVKLDVATDYAPESRLLKATVEIEKLPIFDMIPITPRLTVIIIEEGILHHNQAGYSGDFRHSHVYRKALTDVWGDVISWDGLTAKNELTYDIPDDWVAGNLQVVAFISSYDSSDRNNCKVYNAEVDAVNDPTSIKPIAQEKGEPVSVRYYSPSGVQIPEASKGVCLRVSVYADGSVEGEKIVIK